MLKVQLSTVHWQNPHKLAYLCNGFPVCSKLMPINQDIYPHPSIVFVLALLYKGALASNKLSLLQ